MPFIKRAVTILEMPDGTFGARQTDEVGERLVHADLSGWELVSFLQRLQGQVMESLRTEAVEARVRTREEHADAC